LTVTPLGQRGTERAVVEQHNFNSRAQGFDDLQQRQLSAAEHAALVHRKNARRVGTRVCDIRDIRRQRRRAQCRHRGPHAGEETFAEMGGGELLGVRAAIHRRKTLCVMVETLHRRNDRLGVLLVEEHTGGPRL
jgi:hypothetical protein